MPVSWTSGQIDYFDELHIFRGDIIEDHAQSSRMKPGIFDIPFSGAAMGHASSCVTAMNLIRLGNKKILKNYNCSYFREAAVNVTRITTGYEPHPKQPVYGARSLDLVFGLDATRSR